MSMHFNWQDLTDTEFVTIADLPVYELPSFGEIKEVIPKGTRVKIYSWVNAEGKDWISIYWRGGKDYFPVDASSVELAADGTLSNYINLSEVKTLEQQIIDKQNANKTWYELLSERFILLFELILFIVVVYLGFKLLRRKK